MFPCGLVGISELSDVTSVAHLMLLQVSFVLRISAASLWPHLLRALIVLFPDRSRAKIVLLTGSGSSDLARTRIVWFVLSTTMGSISVAAVDWLLVRGATMLPWLRVAAVCNRLIRWCIVIVCSNTSLFVHFINIKNRFYIQIYN